MAPPGEDGSSASLTAEQQAAVDSVVAQVEAVVAALAGTVDSFDGIDADGDETFGECPVVAVAFVDGVATMTLSFPEGCTNEYYGESPVSGSISVTFDTATLSFDVTFNDFTTNVGTVSGSMALSLQRDGLTAVLAGTVDIAISGVGATMGTITVQFDAEAFVVTITEATLTLTSDDGTEFTVTIDGLVVSPVDNGNFIPEAGTLSFDIPNDGPGPDPITVVVTFDATSPTDGTVQVQVGGGEPVEYQLASAA